MNWLLLTVLAIISRATYSLGTRVLSRDVKVSAITQSLLLTTCAGLLGLLVSPFLGGLDLRPVASVVIPLLLLIIAPAFGNVVYFKGQKGLDAGTTQIAFSSILIWGVILSLLFLGTTFKMIQVVGIILLFLAILLVQNTKGGMKMNSSVMLIIASAILFAVFQVASAGVSRAMSTGTYLVVSYFGQSIIIGTIYFKQIKKDLNALKEQVKNTFTKTVFASSGTLLYFIFSFLAYKYAPDQGIVVILLTSQVVLSVIFGIIFLKERENMTRKLLAGTLACIAGVLIKS